MIHLGVQPRALNFHRVDAGQLIREGIDLVGPDTPAGARLAEQAAFFEFVAKELPEVLTRWDQYRASGPH